MEASSADPPGIDVPVLIVHGTEDRILPFESASQRLPALVKNARLSPVEGRTAPRRVDPP
jgi:non-heme chloroperoxidase